MLHHVLRGSGGASVAYVGGAGASYNGTNLTYSVSLASLTGGIDTQPREGDFVIAITSMTWFNATDNSPSITTAGFTSAGTEADGAPGDRYVDCALYYKVMTAVPNTTITAESSGSTSYGSSTSVHVWRNVDTVTPLDVTPTSTSSNTTAVPNSPSITPVTSGSVILSCVASTADATPTDFTTPTDFGNAVKTKSDGASGVYESITGIASIAWPGGAYDPPAWTGGETDSTMAMAAFTVALRPAT